MGFLKNNFIHSGHILVKGAIETKRIQVINFMVLLGAPVTVLFVVLHLKKGLYAPASLNFVMFLLFASSFIALRLSPKNLPFATIAAFSALMLIQVKTYIFGSIENTSFFWFFTLPAFAAILMPRKIADRWIIFMMTLLIVVFILAVSGVFIPPYSPKILVFLFLSLLVLNSIVRFSQKIQDEYERDLTKAQKDLELALEQTQDSIKYAAMIQSALMPQEEHFHEHFSDSFLHWEPKDIVGGDIYFVDQLQNANKDEVLIMLIDCSGHGVPGALVTMLVKAMERQIVAEINSGSDRASPAKILGFFNRKMKQLLRQEGSQMQGSNAGLDAAILTYNKKTHEVRFAGSQSSLFIVSKGKIQTIKGNRHSIGYKQSDADYEFTEHILSLDDHSSLYLTTDGYLDQNGGPKGYPFGTSRFTNLIKEHHEKPFKDQKDIFLEVLLAYQNEEQRNDDIAMLGFRIIKNNHKEV